MALYEDGVLSASKSIAGDTLPINTIIDYTGTTVPDGWQLTTNDGWDTVPTTMVYASATTITVPSGAALIYSKGDKLKLTQTTVKYFYIVGVADTLLTVTGGSDYTLTNAAISNMYYSHMANPVGFPQWFAFTPVYAGLTIGNGVSAGRFSITEKTVFLHTLLTLGSTSSVTGNFQMTLPVSGSTSYAGTDLVGAGMALLGGTGYSMVMTGGGVTYNSYVAGVNIAYRGISNIIPSTWATGHTLQLSATYEMA